MCPAVVVGKALRLCLKTDSLLLVSLLKFGLQHVIITNKAEEQPGRPRSSPRGTCLAALHTLASDRRVRDNLESLQLKETCGRVLF